MNRLDALLGFLKEDPNDPFLLFAAASEFRKLGNVSEALSYYERLTTDHPAYVGTYYHYGALLASEGRKAEAIDMYQRGIRVAEEQRDFHARAELQNALLNAQGIGLDDDL